MSVTFESFLTLSAPLWLCLCLAAAVLYMAWRLHSMSQLLRRHAQSIANMDAWADATDERLDRLDWAGQRRSGGIAPRTLARRAG
jgi:hypothetical protein